VLLIKSSRRNSFIVIFIKSITHDVLRLRRFIGRAENKKFIFQNCDEKTRPEEQNE